MLCNKIQITKKLQKKKIFNSNLNYKKNQNFIKSTKQYKKIKLKENYVFSLKNLL